MGNFLSAYGDISTFFGSLFGTIVGLSLIIFGIILLAQDKDSIFISLFLIIIGIFIIFLSWYIFYIVTSNKNISTAVGGIDVIQDITKIF